MANFVMNIAKGRFAELCTMPLTADALLLIPVETAGVETDAVLKDLDTVTAFFAGTTNEQTTLGRKSITTGITVVVDDTNDWVDVDVPDQTWVAGTGNAISDLLLAYDNDTAAGTDANIVPLSVHDFTVTPSGVDIVAVIATAGILRAT